MSRRKDDRVIVDSVDCCTATSVCVAALTDAAHSSCTSREVCHVAAVIWAPYLFVWPLVVSCLIRVHLNRQYVILCRGKTSPGSLRRSVLFLFDVGCPDLHNLSPSHQHLVNTIPYNHSHIHTRDHRRDCDMKCWTMSSTYTGRGSTRPRLCDLESPSASFESNPLEHYIVRE
jgi:hypothetical protein